jgi:hypothetical protein
MCEDYMQRRFPTRGFLAAIALASLCVGLARAAKPSQDSELIALNDAWIDAEVHHDKAALERILDDRFLVTLKSGETVNKTTFIDRILSMEIKPFVVVNEVMNIHGDAALVISTSSTTKFTWIAVKKGGRWRVISETFSKITSQT